VTRIAWFPVAAPDFNAAQTEAGRDFAPCPDDHYAVVGLALARGGDITVHGFLPLPMDDTRTAALARELAPVMDEALWEVGL
jgi:hypothetical protein